MKKNCLKKQILFLMVFVCSGCLSGHEVMYYTANTEIPGTVIEMKTPGYWVSQIDEPDSIIMDANQIALFNKDTEKAGVFISNIFDNDNSGDLINLKRTLDNSIQFIRSTKLYHTNGKKIEKSFSDEIEILSNSNNMQYNVDYCFFINNSDLRIIPYQEQLTDVKKELFFDAIQTSRINIGTPGVVVHYSNDAEWVFVKTHNVSAWTKKSNIAICSEDELKQIISKDFVVVTDGKTDVYTDSNCLRYINYTRMGSIFYLHNDKGNSKSVKVMVPFADENGRLVMRDGYINTMSVNKGFIDYTARNSINQAFKLLNSPYGWGGMFGEQDCSQYFCEIFACFGVFLPRNSSSQSLVGMVNPAMKKELSDDDKFLLIKNEAIPGITFLRRPGHIVLYLGSINKDIYVIHAAWGYKENIQSKDVLRVINRVVVSNLRIGHDSKKGSLLQLINRMNSVNR